MSDKKIIINILPQDPDAWGYMSVCALLAVCVTAIASCCSNADTWREKAKIEKYKNVEPLEAIND